MCVTIFVKKILPVSCDIISCNNYKKNNVMDMLFCVKAVIITKGKESLKLSKPI